MSQFHRFISVFDGFSFIFVYKKSPAPRPARWKPGRASCPPEVQSGACTSTLSMPIPARR